MLSSSFKTLSVGNSLLGKLCGCNLLLFDKWPVFQGFPLILPASPLRRRCRSDTCDGREGSEDDWMGRVSNLPGHKESSQRCPLKASCISWQQACFGTCTIVSHGLWAACGKCSLHANKVATLEVDPAAKAVHTVEAAHSEWCAFMTATQAECTSLTFFLVATLSLPLQSRAEGGLGLGNEYKTLFYARTERWEYAQGFASL